MSLYLPPELRWLGWVAGGAWPDGDEDKVWAVASAYRTAGEELRKLTPEIADVKRTAVEAYPEGVGGDKIGALFDQMLTGDQSMDSLAHFMDQIADAAEEFGTSVQAAKLMTIVSLVALAIEIAWAYATWPPTAPIVEASEEAATQIVVRRLEIQIQEKIAAKAAATFAEKFANLGKQWMVKILEGALISGGLDVLVQVGEMGPGGHRKHFNWKEFGASLAAGGAGAPFGRAGANWINKYTSKFFGEKLANPWVRAGNGVIVGVGSSPVFGFFGGVGAGLVTGDWSETLGNPHGWVGGVAHGGLGGGAKAYFGHSRFNNKPFEVEWKLPADGSVNNPRRGGFSFDLGGAGSQRSRNGFEGNRFGGDYATNQNPVGSNRSGGGNQDSVDAAPSPGDRSGSMASGQGSRATHPASSTGHGNSQGSAASPSSRNSQDSSSGSHSGSSGTRSQASRDTGSNYNGSESEGTANSWRYEPLSSDSSHSSNGSSNGHSGSSSGSSSGGSHSSSGSSSGGSGSSSGGSHSSTGSSSGGSGSSSGSSSAGDGRSASPAFSNHSGSSGSSSASEGPPPSRASSSNPSVDNRGSSVINRAGDGPAGGPPATRPSPGSDGSVSQPPKAGIETSSRPMPDSNIVAGQSQRGPASVSSMSSNESGPPPRSSAVSSVGSSDSGQSLRRPAGGNLDGPPPQRSPESGVWPQRQRLSEGETPLSSSRPTGPNLDGPPPRSPGSDMGSNNPKPSRFSVSGSGDQLPPVRRTPDSDSGGSSPSRPRSPESGLPPQRQPLPPSETLRGSVPPEQHSSPNGRRGPDDAEPGVRTFEGDQEHPNWSRGESGDVVVTSSDGTEHWVDKHENIFLGRPEDPHWVKIGPDRSVEFVPKTGNDPVAEPGSWTGGPAREGEVSFTRDDGTEHTVLADGSVRTKSPDESTTIVRRNGSAELRSPWDDRTHFDPDGTATHTRPDDPTTVTTHDNTVHIGTPGRHRDEDDNLVVTSPDGTRHVVGDDRTILVGRPGDPQLLKVEADRSIVFVGPDGTSPTAHPGATSGKGSGVQSPTFTRRDGVSHTVLDDGAVRTKSQGDWTTIVRPNRATEFISPTGDRTVHKADDTVVESGPGKPTVTIGPDQTKQTVEPNRAVTVEHPDSTTHVVFDAADPQGGGRTGHPDGTVIHHDVHDTSNIGMRDRLGGFGQDGARKPGVVQMERPDGTGFESSPNGVKVFDGGTTYERGSGNSVRVTEANGHTEARSLSEPIELSNGARLEKTPGGFRVEHEDRTISEIGPREVRFTDTDEVVRGTRTDGMAFVKHGEDGPLREVRADGAVRITAPDKTSWGSRGDGTTWHVDDKNKVHISAPDGTVAPPVDPRSPYVEGARLTAKIKPHPLSGNGKPIGGYEAPTAPLADDWIPPGYDKNQAPPDPDLPDPDAPEQYWGPQYDWDPSDSDFWPGPDDDPSNGGPPNPGPYDNDPNFPGPGGDDYDHVSGGPGHGGNSGGSDRGGNFGGSDRGSSGGLGGGGNSGGPSGSGEDGGSSGTSRHDGGHVGGSEDRGSSGGDHRSPDNDRPPARHLPPRPDPAMLARMLQNLHAAENTVPPLLSPDGDAGEETNGRDEPSPDFWRLGPSNTLPTAPGGSVERPGTEGSTGASNPSRQLRPGDGNSSGRSDPSAQYRGLDQPGQSRSGGSRLGTPDQPGSPNNPSAGNQSDQSQDTTRQGAPGTQNHPGTSGDEGQPDRSGTPRNSAGEHPLGQPGDPKATGGDNNSGSPGQEGKPGADDNAGSQGSEYKSDGADPSVNPGAGDRSGATDSAAPSVDAGAEDHSGAPGSGDQHGAPGAERPPADPQHPGAQLDPDQHPGVPGQQENSGSSGNGTQSSMPRMPASAMQDGHQSAVPSAPGGAPSASGAPPPGTAPGGASAARQQPRRSRKKDDKPRKKPKSMLMPSPDEDSEQRAGPGDSTDVPFILGASPSATEAVIAKRPTTTIRSTTDG
ncbi:hypothetical protein ACIA8C_12940 [Nocardia sp. NPDC051321]|uniref:WXG100-like domain-containing protein n=1 Tax=Nocardia sp. NPDC051321 TaxID=3364323 RepID=UPI0037B94CE1